MKKFKYSSDQLDFLRTGYSSMNSRGLTKAFNDRFGLDKTENQIRSTVKNHGITSGRTGCFTEGHSPWNTGTKGLTGANKTSFKKGSAPPNRKPLGTERICPRDGFVLMKVAERNPYTGFSTRYKHKSVYVYEQEHGPVPEGSVVAFKDSDKTNCEPENLMLISRAELLNLNRYGYKDTPAELKPSVLALTKLQVKTWEKEKEG